MTDETPEDGTLRLDAEFLDDGDEYRIARKKVLKELANAGIIIAPQPVDEKGEARRPEPIEDFSVLSTEDIQNHLGQYAAWMEYIDGQISRYRIDHEVAARRRDAIAAQIKIKKKGTAADKKAAAVADIRHRRLDLEEFTTWAKMEGAEGVLRGATHEFFTISRGLTARGQDIDRLRRENNTGGGNREYSNLPPSFPRRKRHG